MTMVQVRGYLGVHGESTELGDVVWQCGLAKRAGAQERLDGIALH